MNIWNALVVIVVFTAGILLGLKGYESDQSNLIWLGSLFLIMSVLWLSLVVVEPLAQRRIDAFMQENQKPKINQAPPQCILCSGPPHPFDGTCFCGGNHWDEHTLTTQNT